MGRKFYFSLQNCDIPKSSYLEWADLSRNGEPQLHILFASLLN